MPDSFRTSWRYDIEECDWGIRYWHYGYNQWAYVNTYNNAEGIWQGTAMRRIAFIEDG